MTAGLDEIAASLKMARHRKALTQKGLGERVGIPQSHISKIENGAVDLQISSLVELARALDLEVQLVPRNALPAIRGAIRAQGTALETSRALATLKQLQPTIDRILENYPKLLKIHQFKDIAEEIARLQFNAVQLKALEGALKPAMRIKLLLDQDELTDSAASDIVARQVEEATKALLRFRNAQMHAAATPAEHDRPAYRLDEEDEAE
ncbi:helix-turn-helix domain-containing protein [Novosphingobium sp. JCM 18896]|uniref:helix-turn-helix domain-containing protein n=1 Tax=Novosphingobium sp. JCM 18896 TaxID=2989731 RepID=UPI0022230C29|nr:helix-turn-helix transcriptional regulator [Novosphingobium sp. JCM 18896]MCW1430256.1 helix-turn-helix domain-containing protein [Novosphingobium sp. JCM 18896]